MLQVREQAGLFNNVRTKLRVSNVAKTVHFGQESAIRVIIELHNDGYGFDVDTTYGKGGMWKGFARELHPLQCFDVAPRPGTCADQASSTALPIADQSVRSVMFDPPFLIGKARGKSTQGKMEQQFTMYASQQELLDHYGKSWQEFHRILVSGGIVAFKCQDTVNAGKQRLNHVDVIAMGRSAGFVDKDLFIIISDPMIGSMRNQYHARKNHCYFVVMAKPRGR